MRIDFGRIFFLVGAAFDYLDTKQRVEVGRKTLERVACIEPPPDSEMD